MNVRTREDKIKIEDKELTITLKHPDRRPRLRTEIRDAIIAQAKAGATAGYLDTATNLEVDWWVS